MAYSHWGLGTYSHGICSEFSPRQSSPPVNSNASGATAAATDLTGFTSFSDLLGTSVMQFEQNMMVSKSDRIGYDRTIEYDIQNMIGTEYDILYSWKYILYKSI